MPAPILEAEYESAWNTATTPKTAAVTVNAQDVLVVVASTADQGSVLTTPTGGGFTYALRQSVVVAAFSTIYVWTVDPVNTGQAFTLSVGRAGGAGEFWGFNCYRFSGTYGIGASSSTNAAGPAAPTLNITTTQANSAIAVINSDWSAADGTVRTWRTGAGALTEQTYFRDVAWFTTYNGFHSDAGAAGTYAVGLTAPATQKYAIGAVEILGTGTPPTPDTRGILRRVPRGQRVRR